MQTRMIPVGDLLPPVIEMREVMTLEGLDELAASINKNGLLQPLTVRVEGEKFRIIAGARRFEACRRIQMPDIPCSIVDVDDQTAEEMKIHENLKREDVDPVEESNYYMRLYSDMGWSVDDLVARTGRTQAYIDGRLEIAAWPQDIKDALQSKAIPIAVGRELVKFKDEDVRRGFLRSAADFNAAASLVRSWRERWVAEKEMADRQATQAADGSAPPPPPPPLVLCAFCGEDLAGHIVQYVPVSQRCFGEMQYISAESMRRRSDAERARVPV